MQATSFKPSANSGPFEVEGKTADGLVFHLHSDADLTTEADVNKFVDRFKSDLVAGIYGEQDHEDTVSFVATRREA